MGNQRTFIRPTRKVCNTIHEDLLKLKYSQTYEVKLRGRLYPVLRARPYLVPISTRCSPVPKQERYPFAESVLTSSVLQPYVHDIKVTIDERGHRYCYRVFFKRHCRLLKSLSLFNLDNDSDFCGDAVVMRVGCRGNFVNMRERDTTMADYLIIK
jgi:hypothetical protein